MLTQIITQLTLIANLGTATPFQGPQANCDHFFVAGSRPVLSAQHPTQHREICFDTFAVLHSGESKTPLYAAQRLNRQRVTAAKALSRTDRFYEEARLPASQRARLVDYADGPQGYDRGHVAPAGDQYTVQGKAQSFSLANIVPQDATNNRGVWRKVEADTRRYVERASGDVFIVTGAVFGTPPKTLGPGKVWVPQHLYKVVYDVEKQKRWAYWVENSSQAAPPRPISYEELVRRTNIQFF